MMASNEDWWGYLIFVVLIVVIVIFVIKILLEFPGLLEWNFICSDSEDENSESDQETDEIVEVVGQSGGRETDKEMRIDKLEEC
jgi:hypothetical protein